MADEKFVKARLPARYGSVLVRGPAGETEHRGGAVVVMDRKQAAALGAELVTDAPAPPAQPENAPPAAKPAKEK